MSLQMIGQPKGRSWLVMNLINQDVIIANRSVLSLVIWCRKLISQTRSPNRVSNRVIQVTRRWEWRVSCFARPLRSTSRAYKQSIPHRVNLFMLSDSLCLLSLLAMIAHSTVQLSTPTLIHTSTMFDTTRVLH